MRNLIKKILRESKNKVDYSELRHSGDLTGLKLRDKNGTIYTVTNQIESQLSMIVDFTHSQRNIKPRKMTMWLKILVEYLDRGVVEIIELPGGTDINLDKLYESEEDEFEWARDVISNSLINVGDVFYIVDGYAGRNVLPWSHRPKDVRYVLSISEIGPDWIEKIQCDTDDVTYNKNDYTPRSNKCQNGDRSTLDLDRALELINKDYWRKM